MVVEGAYYYCVTYSFSNLAQQIRKNLKYPEFLQSIHKMNERNKTLNLYP